MNRVVPFPSRTRESRLELARFSLDLEIIEGHAKLFSKPGLVSSLTERVSSIVAALDKVSMTYYDHWENGKPDKAEGNGSFVTHSAHAAFHYALLMQTAVDLCIQCYTVFLILCVGTKKLRVFRYYLLLCMVSLPIRDAQAAYSPLNRCF